MRRPFSCCLHAFVVLSAFSLAPLPALPQSGASQPQSASPARSETTSTPAPAAAPALDAPALDTQEPAVAIRQTVRRVLVDVTVRDSNGKPVRGLAAGHFSITEDKQPQRVLSFDAYDLDKPSLARKPNAPPLPPNVFENIPASPEHGPLYVMLFDMVNMESEDEMSARAQVLKFIKSKPAGTRFCIFVTTDKLRMVQGFTDDKDQLNNILDGKHASPHVPRIFQYGRNYGHGDPSTVLDMLTNIGAYLDGIPGRKNLLWISGKFPVSLFAREGDPTDLRDEFVTMINALAQAQIAVYPLDVSGVQLDISAAFANDYRSEDEIAAMTGGRAHYSTNDLASALGEATEDGGNYYTLTYSPGGEEDNGKCHKISVKLDSAKLDPVKFDPAKPDPTRFDKEHYHLAYRQQYCRALMVSAATEDGQDAAHPNHAGGPAVAVPLQAGDLLQGNIRPGAPMLHDLSFSAHMHTDRAALATPAQMQQLEMQSAAYRTQPSNRPLRPLPAVKIQTYTIDYRVFDPQFKPATNRGPRRLEFAVAAFDEDGRVLNGIVNDAVQDAAAQASAKASDDKHGLFRMQQTLIVPVTAKSIRVGMRDRANDRMGTLEVPLPLAQKGATN